MVISARRLIIALTSILALFSSSAASASVVYQFVLSEYTGTAPFTDGLADIRLTLSDAAHGSGAVNFNQTGPLTPWDPPSTTGSGVEQFSWWIGDRLPAGPSVHEFDAKLAIGPKNDLTGDIFFASFEDTLRLAYDSAGGIWRGIANSDRPPVCSGDEGCTFAGYFVAVPEPGSLTVLSVALVGLGLAARRRRTTAVG